jgi:DNA repair photolyase
MLNSHASADPMPVRKDLRDDQQKLFAAAESPPQIPIGAWPHPAVISENNFIFKSLSSWSFNIAVGCSHGCTFCYVPSVATVKQAKRLSAYGVTNPDEEWGRYVLLRNWNELRFLASLRAAESTPRSQLNLDGNRAVIYCSTTDPYQVFRHPDSMQRKDLADSARHLVRRSLELIRDRSTLNVRILTRSPLAKRDFDLFRSFGKRLLFGMSLPTLRDDLARVYEPKAPAPSQRLKTLQAAKDAGLHVFVAMAPTYPECDELDLDATLKAAAQLNPITIFHEPINIRAENVERIKAQALSCGVPLKTEVFATATLWQDYARSQLKQVYQLAKRHKLTQQLHLWPDKSLGSMASLRSVKDPVRYIAWLQQQWNRVSAWPQ